MLVLAGHWEKFTQCVSFTHQIEVLVPPFPGVGGVGLPEIKANSAQFQAKLPIGAELGNIFALLYMCKRGLKSALQVILHCGGFVVGGWGKSKIKLHSRQIPEVWLRLAKRNQTFW